MSVKEILKTVPVLREVNARLKSWQMHRQLDRLEWRYSQRAHAMRIHPGYGARDFLVRRRQAQRNFVPVPRKKGWLEIVWIGANEAQDYGGFMQSLEAFGHVSILRRRTDYGQHLTDPWRNDAYVLEHVKDTIYRAGRVDVVLGQMWGQYLSSSTLQNIQQLGCATANVSMDDRLPEMWQPGCGSLGLLDGLDLVLTSDPNCVLWYATHGCPATFWPMASHPDLFTPAPVKDIPLSFVGNKYGIRGELVAALEAAGIHVECYGAGWPNGLIDAKAVIDVMNRSQMVLGVSTVGHTRDLCTLKLRDFDATMAGACYVTQRHPYLFRCFTEEYDIACYRDAADLVRTVQWYRDLGPVAIANMGKMARQTCLRHHTWDHRLTEAFHLLGVLQ